MSTTGERVTASFYSKNEHYEGWYLHRKQFDNLDSVVFPNKSELFNPQVAGDYDEN